MDGWMVVVVEVVVEEEEEEGGGVNCVYERVCLSVLAWDRS